jgi:tRNA dimethylallyltransferase
MNKSISPTANPVALIAGPTASGKSALAVRLAEMTGGVVINADASQVYADLRVLSARPDAAEEARAEHRLFGYRDAATACSAADWAADAKAEIAKAHAAGQLPIMVGGTGLYIRTLILGIAPVPEIDPAIRAEVRGMAVEAAHAALMREDPDMAARLRPQDSSRVARALEVIRSTRRSLARWRQELVGGIGNDTTIIPAILLPPRAWLRHRCDQRFEAMLEQGAIEEVDALRARRLDPALPAMLAVGVREISGWRDGLLSYREMVALAQAATRQYAKRQYTWFRRQPPTSLWRHHDTQLDDKEIEIIATKLRKDALTA